MWQVTGQGTQVALRIKDFGQAGDLAGCDRGPRQGRFRSEQRGNGGFALLGLQRTGAIDQRAARLEQSGRLLEQALLQGGQRGDLGFLAQPGDVGVTANRAGRSAGRIDEDAVDAAMFGAAPFGGVSDNGLGAELQPRQIILQPRDAGG